MSNNIYNILGRINNVAATELKSQEDQKNLLAELAVTDTKKSLLKNLMERYEAEKQMSEMHSSDASYNNDEDDCAYDDRGEFQIHDESVTEDDVADFIAQGGKVQHGKYHGPRASEKWKGSAHIGTGRGGKSSNISGKGANTHPNSNKPVVGMKRTAEGASEDTLDEVRGRSWTSYGSGMRDYGHGHAKRKELDRELGKERQLDRDFSKTIEPKVDPKDDSNEVDPRQLRLFDQKQNAKRVSESSSLKESIANIGLERIERRFPYEMKRFKEGGSCADLGSDFFDAVFDYYLHSGEMPYGVAKGREGDPMQWCDERLSKDLDVSEMAAFETESAVEPVMPESETGHEETQFGEQMMDEELSQLARLAGLSIGESKNSEKANKDYDGDGEVESEKDEVWGSRMKAAEKEKVDECGMSPVNVMGAPEPESRMNISTNMDSDGHSSVTISAQGEQAAALLQMLKLAGFGHEEAEKHAAIIAVEPDASEEAEEEVEEEYANEPEPEYGTVDQQMSQGTDLNRQKRQDPSTANRAANPIAETRNKLDEISDELRDRVGQKRHDAVGQAVNQYDTLNAKAAAAGNTARTFGSDPADASMAAAARGREAQFRAQAQQAQGDIVKAQQKASNFDNLSAMRDYRTGVKKDPSGEAYEQVKVGDRIFYTAGASKPIPGIVRDIKLDPKGNTLASVKWEGNLPPADQAIELRGEDGYWYPTHWMRTHAQVNQSDRRADYDNAMRARDDYHSKWGMSSESIDPLEALGRKLMREYQGMKISEGNKSKPDFLDVDKDGDKKEPMKKALKDKKGVKESQLAEISAEKAEKYISRALGDFTHQHMASRLSRTEKERSDAAHKKQMRNQGISRAYDRLDRADNKNDVTEGEGKTQKYEMMMRNGQVKKFVAKDDADAKRIAAGHGAKSVIRLKGGVPAGKVSEQGVAEGNQGTDNLKGTPVVSLKDFDSKDYTKNKYGQTVPKKLKKDDPRVKFHKDQEVTEGEEDRKQNRIWAQITDYEKRAKATKDPIKKDHLMKMASELRGKLNAQ